MNNISNLSLEKVLYYLSILLFENLPISSLSLKSISIKLHGTILKNLNKEILIDDLNQQLNSLFQDHQFREELSFGITRENYEEINPKYYGKSIGYTLQKNSAGEISLFEVKY